MESGKMWQHTTKPSQNPRNLMKLSKNLTKAYRCNCTLEMAESGGDLRRLFETCDRRGVGAIGRVEFRDLCATFEIDAADSDTIFSDLDRDRVSIPTQPIPSPLLAWPNLT